MRLKTTLPLLAALTAVLAACATPPPAMPTHYFASWAKDKPQAGTLVDQIDARMREEPGFVRGFEDPLNVRVSDAVPVAEGVRFDIEMKSDAIVADRLIGEKDRMLARFSVTCAPERWAPCVDPVVVRAHKAAARMHRLAARARPATAADRQAIQAARVTAVERAP